MGELLHIRVCGVELLHGNGIQQSYYSITYKERQYFTSTFTHTTPLPPDDIIIPLEDGKPPDLLILHRWENCMVVFEFQVDSSELRNRRLVRKRVEGRQLELLSLELQLYNGKEIFMAGRYFESISQHYLIFEELLNLKEAGGVRAHQSLNYFTIETKGSRFFLPVRSAVVSVKLPAAIQISSFVNSHFNGKSALLDHSRLLDGQEVDILKDGKCTARVRLKLKWGVNLHRFRSEENVLVEASEMLLYDFQLKFDSPNQVAGCRLKVQHGSKAFQFAEDIDHSKVTKIKKIVYFMIKSDSEEVDLLLHKNGKPFAACRLSSAELTPHALTLIKKKWVDINNATKVYGYVKLRGERARNVSIPQWNRYWREAAKRKQTATNMLISLQQVSLYFPGNQPLALVAKIENQEKVLKPVLNLNFYDDQDGPSPETLDFAVKGEESLYLIVKSDLKSSDFCGIGVVNTTELRLGMNACEVGFFKNQEKAGTINCIIQKVVFWPFLKPLFQPDVAQQPLPPLPVDLFLNKITLTPYFYTYKYDNKRELYCIVEVNKSKKVLILENVEHDPLSFAAAAGSDALNYIVQQPQLIKIKLTFLVSDLGHEEEIYGVAACKARAQDLDQKEIKFKNIQIRNDYSVGLGTVTLEAFRGVAPKLLPKLPPQPQKKSIGSFDQSSQASFDTSNALTKQSPSRRYYSGSSINNSKPMIHDFLKKNTHPIKQMKEVKLPVIKEKKDKNQFQDLVQLMKVRKRGHGGFYQDNKGEEKEREVRKHGQSFDLKRIQQSNPNLDRNLEILFPKKGNEKQIQSSRAKHVDYEERLRGLRSVMNEMEDIGQVQPSLGGESRRERYEQVVNESEERALVEAQEAEWQGNEFL